MLQRKQKTLKIFIFPKQLRRLIYFFHCLQVSSQNLMFELERINTGSENFFLKPVKVYRGILNIIKGLEENRRRMKLQYFWQ